ncbi:MAG: DUF86 domain-containing protein [Deltaproteobacteria bacterium]|nr:DUF86 domain-containing protein [Deltaproteobacteria bacterium]
MKPSLDKETILVRMSGIQEEVAQLQLLGQEPFDSFSKGVGFKLAQYHLHRALEGVFHVASHILARLPGGARTGTYKELAFALGEKGIVPQDFASQKLVKMAGFRNRLVHFYAQITPKEIYNLLNNDLGDFEIFLSSIKKILP